MSSDDRLTWGLVMEILDALEKHGYHRADNQHTGRSIGLIADLARIYEGTQEAPAGAYVVQTPASPPADADLENPASANEAGFGAAQRKTILAALDEAADHKRDLAANCAGCPDQSCGNCQFRLDQARSYDAVTARLLHTADRLVPEPPAISARPRTAPDRDAEAITGTTYELEAGA